MTYMAFEGLMFAYESTAAASYLVIKCDSRLKVFDYQVSMAAVNKIGRITNFDKKFNNGYTYFYYNITSMLTLSLLLKRRKLSRNEFIRLLADITRLLVDCEGYLLSGSSFILDANYLYINPETLDISMIYIPIDTGYNITSMLGDFILDLILKHADIDESDKDNFIQ